MVIAAMMDLREVPKPETPPPKLHCLSRQTSVSAMRFSVNDAANSHFPGERLWPLFPNNTK